MTKKNTELSQLFHISCGNDYEKNNTEDYLIKKPNI